MTLLIDSTTVEKLLTPAIARDAVTEAMRAISRNEGWLPGRTVGELGQGKRFGSMPAAGFAPATLGAKFLSFFPGNATVRKQTTHGLVALFDPHEGSVIAILDGGAITALRTAAASALATQILSQPGARTLGVFGTGALVACHVTAIAAIRPIDAVYIWGRAPEKVERVAAEITEASGLPAFPANAEEAAGADVICTLTASATPILRGEWLRPGCHVNLVGASSPDSREIDSAGMSRSRLFVDARAAALKEAGDLLIPIGEGKIGSNHILGEIGQVIQCDVPGRVSPDDITVYKSVGHIMQDLVVSDAVFRVAKQDSSMPRFNFLA